MSGVGSGEIPPWHDQAQVQAELHARRQAWTVWARMHVPPDGQEAAINAAMNSVARGQSSDEAARAALAAGGLVVPPPPMYPVQSLPGAPARPWSVPPGTPVYKRWSRRTRILVAVGGAVVAAFVGIGTGVSIAAHFVKSQDLASAQGLVLKASDLPTGWDSAPDTDVVASGLDLAPQFAHCLGADPSVFDNNTVQASSDDFSMTNGATAIQNNVYISKSAAVAEQIFETMSGPKVANCSTESFKSGLPSPSSLGYSTNIVTTDRLNVSNYLDHTFATRTTTTLSNGPSSFSPFRAYDIIWMQLGRVNAEFFIYDTDRLFDSSLEDQIIKTLADRMARFAGSAGSSTSS